MKKTKSKRMTFLLFSLLFFFLFSLFPFFLFLYHFPSSSFSLFFFSFFSLSCLLMWFWVGAAPDSLLFFYFFSTSTFLLLGIPSWNFIIILISPFNFDLEVRSGVLVQRDGNLDFSDVAVAAWSLVDYWSWFVEPNHSKLSCVEFHIRFSAWVNEKIRAQTKLTYSRIYYCLVGSTSGLTIWGPILCF